MTTSCSAVGFEDVLGQGNTRFSTLTFPTAGARLAPDITVFAPCAQRYLVFESLVIPLGGKLEMLIGSSAEECDLVLLGARVSRQHAVIRYHDGCYFIQDLGTLHGTFVNGRRINGTVELHVGDEIVMKPYRLHFTDSRPQAWEDTARLQTPNSF